MKIDKQNDTLVEQYNRGAQYCSAKVAADRSAFIKAEEENKAKPSVLTAKEKAEWMNAAPM